MLRRTKLSRRAVLRASAALPAVPSAFADPVPDGASLVPVMDLELRLSAPVDLGSAGARRRLWRVVGGRFSGPAGAGEVREGEIELLRADGASGAGLAARYTLVGADGSVVRVEDQGRRDRRPGGDAMLRSSPRFEGAPALDHAVHVAVIDDAALADGVVRVRVSRLA